MERGAVRGQNKKNGHQISVFNFLQFFKIIWCEGNRLRISPDSKGSPLCRMYLWRRLRSRCRVRSGSGAAPPRCSCCGRADEDDGRGGLGPAGAENPEEYGAALHAAFLLPEHPPAQAAQGLESGPAFGTYGKMFLNSGLLLGGEPVQEVIRKCPYVDMSAHLYFSIIFLYLSYRLVLSLFISCLTLAHSFTSSFPSMSPKCRATISSYESPSM